MTDEIEIEEHDLLDDPAIKNIFPDLSKLKKEIEDYYDDDPELGSFLTTQTPNTSDKGSYERNVSDGLSILESETPLENFFGNCENELDRPLRIEKTQVQFLTPMEKFLETSHDSEIEQLPQAEKTPLFTTSNNIIENSQENEWEPQLGVDTQVQLLTPTDDFYPNSQVSELETQPKTMNNLNQLITPSVIFLGNSQDSELKPQLTKEKTHVQSFSNKIILGSKPTQSLQDKREYFEKHVKPFSAVVKLVKFGEYLHNSSRYCRDCMILFPDTNNFNDHQKLVHASKDIDDTVDTSEENVSLLTENFITINQNVSTANDKSNYQIDKKTGKYKCHLCNRLFVKLGNLRIHIKDLHHDSKFQTKLGKITKRKNIPLSKTSKPVQDKNNECFHCKKKFTNQKALIEHIYSILQNTKNDKTTDLKENAIKKSNSAVKPGKNFPIKEIKKQPIKNNEIVKQIIKPHSKVSNSDGDNEFYKCPCCTYYFRKIMFYAMHLKKKHRMEKIPTPRKVKYDPECKDCKTKYGHFMSYNQHIMKWHPVKLNERFGMKKGRINVATNNSKKENKSINIKDKQTQSPKSEVYRCCYCSYYFNYSITYEKHIQLKHNVTRIPKANKVAFSPKCKYCPSTLNSVVSYNIHLNKFHRKRVQENFKIRSENIPRVENANVRKLKTDDIIKNSVKSDSTKTKTAPECGSFLMTSAIFKCNKCDIHFLTLKAAADHRNHIEILINWKCSLCNRIFKKNDQLLHEKQHTLSDNLNVYNMTEKNVMKVLYKCSKCTIHFDDKNQSNHLDCGSKTPQSTYCKSCDILIANDAVRSHESRHKIFKPTDFIIIESEFDSSTNKHKPSAAQSRIKPNLKRKMNNISSGTITTKKKIKNLLKFSYCSTCKCFLSIMGLRSGNIHIDSACSHIKRHTCYECGLTLTPKAIYTHQKLHSNKKNLVLQDYTFCDLKTGEKICPPLPDYRRCVECSVHFISKSAIRSHLCNEKEYKTCQICSIKLSKSIYHLHMGFHSYSMVNIKPQVQKESKISKIEILESNLPKPNKLLKRSSLLLLFCCKNCNITVDTYDKLVLHCQEHFINNKSIISHAELCKICELKIDSSCYDAHTNLHQASDENRFEKLDYDVFYFRMETNVWLKHVFGLRPQGQVQEIIKKSIYQFEHRIKMEIIKEGTSDITLYKCGKCQSYVEPSLIYKHTKISCESLRKFPCSVCSLPFITSLSRTHHEKYHERPDFSSKSYRTVIFNSTEDSKVTTNGHLNDYVFYQCRNCNGAVEKCDRINHICSKIAHKKCTDCGLFLKEDDYEAHILKHKRLKSFISENMKVILFGQAKSDTKSTVGELKASFRGSIFDYSFYKCLKCEVCTKHLNLDHVCINANLKSQCPKCSIYLYSSFLISHLKKHEVDPDFEVININLKEFDPSTLNRERKDEKLEEKDQNLSEQLNEVGESVHNSIEIKSSESEMDISHPANKENEDNIDIQKDVMIYKCSCGLHFLDESTANTHLDHCGKNKQSKQNCSKCGLLFTPNVLFTHLLTHHGDIKNVFKFKIIAVPKTS